MGEAVVQGVAPQPAKINPLKSMLTFPRKACVPMICLAVLSALTATADPVWQWAVRGASAGTFDSVLGRGIAADAQGNVYVAGKFSGTATFGDTNSSLASFGDSDAFLAKYTSSGQLQWVKHFGGTGSDEAHAVAVDTNGFVYVAGRYSGPGTFGSFTLTNTGFATGFTFKFDPATTNVVWAKDDGLEWWGLAVDGNGNSYVVGQPLGLQIAGSKLAGPIALVKYNSSGTRQWYTNTLAPSLFTIGSGKAIAVDTNGNVYITGIFHSVVEFGSTSLTNAAVANNTRDEIFVAKYSSSGVPQWARRGGGEGDDQGLGIGVDGAGNVIVTGLCDLTTSLNSGTSVQFDIGGFVFPADVNHGGLGNMFLAKFNSSGNGVWAKKLPGISLGTAVSATRTGEFYVAGDFKTNPLDFGGVTLTKSHTLEELFAVKYDASGNAIWGRSSSSPDVGTRFGRGIVPAADGSVYETGEYQGTFPTEFDGTILGSKSTGPSMFVAKLAAAGPSRPTVQNLTLANGVVTMTVPNSDGQMFVIEGSSTLSGFAPIATNQVSGGVLQFTDPAYAGAAARFYRLRVP